MIQKSIENSKEPFIQLSIGFILLYLKCIENNITPSYQETIKSKVEIKQNTYN